MKRDALCMGDTTAGFCRWFERILATDKFNWIFFVISLVQRCGLSVRILSLLFNWTRLLII